MTTSIESSSIFRSSAQPGDCHTPMKSFEIIDLSQEIFSGMPVFPTLPDVKITVHQSHEELEGITNSSVISPAVNLLQMGETQVPMLTQSITWRGSIAASQSIGCR